MYILLKEMEQQVIIYDCDLVQGSLVHRFA